MTIVTFIAIKYSKKIMGSFSVLFVYALMAYRAGIAPRA